METTVIILNFNGERYLKACLDAALAQSYKDYELLFIDNASSDGSVAFVHKHYARQINSKRLRVIINDENYGFAEGNNIGYRAAKASRFVVLLNNDTIVDKRWLGELVGKAKRYPSLGLLGTGVQNDDAFQQSLLKQRLTGINVSTEHASHLTPIYKEASMLDTFYVSGNGVLIRKAFFKQPFDPDYFAYAEDVYLSWLCRLKGKDVAVDLNARMRHLGAGTKKATSKSFNRKLLFHGGKNQAMNILLFYEKKNIIKVLPLFLLTQVGHIIDNPRKIGVKIKVLWWVCTHPRLILRKRKAIQAQRKVPDDAIIRNMTGEFYNERMAASHYNRFYQTLIKLLNRCSLLYCRIVGLRTAEFQD